MFTMLDNNGWGLSSMIAFSSIIIIALLVATFFVISLYSQMDKSLKEYQDSYKQEYVEEEEPKEEEPDNTSSVSIYLDYEEALRDAALAYARACNCFTGAEFVRVEYVELLELCYMIPMLDKDGSSCSGYVDVYPQDDEYITDSYIKCNNYITEGYNE